MPVSRVELEFERYECPVLTAELYRRGLYCYISNREFSQGQFIDDMSIFHYNSLAYGTLAHQENT